MKKFFKISISFALICILGFALLSCSIDDEDEIVAISPVEGSEFISSDQNSSFKVLPLNFNTDNPDITAIEVNQVLSYGKNSNDGSYYPIENFVAGKETAVFVTFKNKVNIPQDGSMTLTISKDGNIITDLLPSNSGNQNYAYFYPRNMADVKNWQMGGYSFEFKSNLGTATRQTNFYPSKNIKVLAVPVIANYSGKVIRCSGDYKKSSEFLYATYPLGKNNLEYILAPELDLSDDMYDLNSEDGMYNVWEALANLQTKSKDYELIIGFVRNNPLDGSLAGYTYGLPANIVTESDGDMQATVAHEVAHCYKVGDEYPGGTMNPNTNEPPYKMKGSGWNGGKVEGSKEAVVGGNSVGLDGSGSVINDNQRPFYVLGQKNLTNVTSYMGSGLSNSWDFWTTSDIWNQLFKAFTGVNVDPNASTQIKANNQNNNSNASDDSDESIGTCIYCYEEIYEPTIYGECFECEELTEIYGLEPFICDYCDEENDIIEENVVIECESCEELMYYVSLYEDEYQGKQTQTDITAIDITGVITEAGVFTKTPWYIYETDKTNLTVTNKGEYEVSMLDSNGNQLSKTFFDMNFIANSNPPRKIDKSPVNITTRYPQNTSKIVIKKGDKEIYSENVSKNTPQIEFINLNENQKLDDIATISWKGVDADDDTIYYELWYCPNEDDFINVATNITSTSIEVNFSEYPGTKDGYFYLYATDGILTSEIDSPTIQVNYKAPEILYIQDEIIDYKITDEIFLDIDIYDIQDGWIYDDVQWLLDGREFMTGSMLWIWPYEVAPGEHTLTVKATNSEGISSSKDYNFRIINDESALPNDWSKEEIKEALSNGFVAPLNDINSAITRGRFATLMAGLYYDVWEEGSKNPDYEEGIVTDCGNDDFDQFLMVKLGLMDAPNGRFNPNGNLTELEAGIIMYNTIFIADPQLVKKYDNPNDIIEVYLDNNVIEKDGNNVYNADKKITGQLALVRLNRLYNIIYE